MIETIINSCLHHQCLLSVTTHHPLTNTQSFIGMLTPDNNMKDKIRLHLYDDARHVFLYDDMGEKMFATIKKAHIKTLKPIQNIITPTKTILPQMHHKTRLYNTYLNLRKPTIKKVTRVEAHHLSRVFLHENILAINQTSRVIPVISYHLKFNTNTNIYEKTLYIHHEQPLHLFFHTIPKTGPLNQLVKRFKAFIKSHITVNETEFTFIMRPRFKTIKPTMIMRPMHHPYKALNQVLTPKNLGRKVYRVPPLDASTSPTITQTLMASLTHPVTLSYLPHSLGDIVQTYQQGALLNQKNILFIAPQETIKALPPSPWVLPLINHTVLDDAIDQFLDMSDEIPVPSISPDIDYHDFFTAMTTYNHKVDYMKLLTYLKAVFEENAMNEYAIRLDALINQQEQGFVCDIDLLYTMHHYTSDIKQTLQYYQAKQRNKLSLPLYKEIYDVFTMKNKDKRRQEVLKWMNNPKVLNRLKNIFPIIMTHEHSPLFPYQIRFDMLVAYTYKKLAYYHLGLSPKITMIVANNPHIEFEQKTSIISQQYTVFDQFYLSNTTTIKQFNMPNPLLNRTPIIHDIKAINYAKHTVYNHVEYIQTMLNKVTEPLAIRTPFHAQKTILKNDLNSKDIHTIYVPTTKRMVLSLPIHPHTPQHTYDWIKNHAHIEKILEHSPLDIIVDVASVYHLTSHEDTLAKTIDFYHQVDKKLHHITLDKTIDLLLSVCLKDSHTTLNEDVELTDVFPNHVIPKIKTVAYFLQSQTHKIACIELPYSFTKSQYQGLLQISRQNTVTLIPFYKTHKGHIEQLINILKTIDLLKAR